MSEDLQARAYLSDPSYIHEAGVRGIRLDDEIEIVWVIPRQDVIKLPYVRQHVTSGYTFRPATVRGNSTLIAYAVKKKTERGSGGRRVWRLRSTDPYPDGRGPIEHVDPRTIKAGQPCLPMTIEQDRRLGEFSK